MKSAALRNPAIWFVTGAGFVYTVAFAFIILSLGFILGFPLDIWQFPLALLLMLTVNYFTCRYLFDSSPRKIFILSSLLILSLVTLFVMMSAFFYDISADGQMYHMEASIQMLKGWNPFRFELPQDLNQAIWLNHYGKGIEGPQATIFAITHLIETTKSTNFILLAASFCLSMSFFLKTRFFSSGKSFLFSMLLSCNPVTIYQLLNTYVDGQLASFLLCFMAVTGLLFLEWNKYLLLLLSVILIVLINIKFTAIVFAAVYSLAALIIFFIYKNRGAFRKLLLVIILSSVFAIVVVGWFPYMINTLKYHDVLYPGLQVLKSEALKFTPPRLRHQNVFTKFFISFFSHTDNLHLSVDKDPAIPAKIPFTFDRKDFFNASKPYVVFAAGLGPFFSGLFISAFCLFVFTWRKMRNKAVFLQTGITVFFLLFSVWLISEAWYFRYVPQLWCIPVSLFIASEVYKNKRADVLRSFLYAIMVINISFCFVSFPYVYFKTAEIKYELEQLKSSHQIIPVEFTYFTSNRRRFIENDIPFREISISDSAAVFMSSSSTKIIPPQLPDLPKPMVLRMGKKMADRFNIRP